MEWSFLYENENVKKLLSECIVNLIITWLISFLKLIFDIWQN